MTLGTLDYRGNAGIDDMAAFNARVQQTWRGDNLFRVYPADGTLYFIRIGGAKQQNAAVAAQFGLIGGLIMYFANKRARRKEQAKLNEIAGNDPRELMGSHKYNFALPVEDVAGATILPPAMMSGTGGRMQLALAPGRKPKRYNCTFDDADNVRAAIAHLAPVLADRLDVKAEYDDAKKKYRKPKAAKA